jgi:hypothetical protein
VEVDQDFNEDRSIKGKDYKNSRNLIFNLIEIEVPKSSIGTQVHHRERDMWRAINISLTHTSEKSKGRIGGIRDSFFICIFQEKEVKEIV